MLKRILMSIAECPFSPTSGAGRSMRGVCELLAQRGFDVYAVCTTASELAYNVADLGQHGITPRHGRGTIGITFEHRGVKYWMLDAGDKTIRNWRNAGSIAAFDNIFNQALRSIAPHSLLTFGGLPEECARQDRARAQGAKIVFSVRNYEYQQPGFFHERKFDGVFTGSQFLTDFYKRKIGLESTPLPLPMIPEDVIAKHWDPKYFTAVNPKREKGVVFLLRLITEINQRRPDIQFLIVESETPCPVEFRSVVKAGALPCFITDRSANPKDYLRHTKCLLQPALWEEPAGRTVPEALMNGIPVITSGRGGLAEVALGGAYVLPIDPRISPASNSVTLSDVQPWMDVIIQLQDSRLVYEYARQKACEAGLAYDPTIVGPLYADYFTRILTGQTSPAHFSAETARTDAANNQEATC